MKDRQENRESSNGLSYKHTDTNYCSHMRVFCRHTVCRHHDLHDVRKSMFVYDGCAHSHETDFRIYQVARLDVTL